LLLLLLFLLWLLLCLLRRCILSLLLLQGDDHQASAAHLHKLQLNTTCRPKCTYKNLHPALRAEMQQQYLTRQCATFD
jgi:hypothetical protein